MSGTPSGSVPPSSSSSGEGRPTPVSSYDDEETNRLTEMLKSDVLAFSMSDTVSSCGGSIAVGLEASSSDPLKRIEETLGATVKNPVWTGPISIRFSSGTNTHSQLLLPTQYGDHDALNPLINACDPASFGRGGQDVFDETYRKALKLNTEQFDTNFCPYTSGIINAVTQVLLPGVLDTRALEFDGPYLKDNMKAVNRWYTKDKISPAKAAKKKEAKERARLIRRPRGIRAELYKLNIYREGDKFKSHVDTPRGNNQIGSLVVALPCHFKGGALHVRQFGREDIYDWSSEESSPAEIRWAAFYSDCDHEVMTIESGYRITLTYNLFVEPLTGLLVNQAHGLHLQSTSLYRNLHQALINERFMSEGGKLGVYLYYKYPHTNEALYHDVHHALKGIDMVLFETMRFLGLEISLIPVATNMQDEISYHNDRRDEAKADGKDVRPEVSSIYAERLKPLELFENWAQEEDAFTTLTVDRIGWGKTAVVGEITRLNSPKHHDVQGAYLTYGNEADLNFIYSAIAMIVKIEKKDHVMSEQNEAGADE